MVNSKKPIINRKNYEFSILTILPMLNLKEKTTKKEKLFLINKKKYLTFYKKYAIYTIFNG